MDEEARRYARIVQRNGTEMQVVEEIVSCLSKEDLNKIRHLVNRHYKRVGEVWVYRDSGKTRKTKLTNLTDMRLYTLLKGNHVRGPRVKVFRLEAEMRGIWVDGKLRDPSIDNGQRTLPYGLLEQCK